MKQTVWISFIFLTSGFTLEVLDSTVANPQINYVRAVPGPATPEPSPSPGCVCCYTETSGKYKGTILILNRKHKTCQSWEGQSVGPSGQTANFCIKTKYENQSAVEDIDKLCEKFSEDFEQL